MRLEHLDVLPLGYLLHCVLGIKDQSRILLHHLIIHIGVSGGNHDKVCFPEHLLVQLWDALADLTFVFVLLDPWVEEGDLCALVLQLLDDPQRRAFTVVVDVLFVGNASTSTFEPFIAFFARRLSILAARSTQYSGILSLIIIELSIIEVWKPYSLAFQER